MTEWLVFTLAAPLASFGERAGASRRGSADRPTRSALLGLLGAALGVERADAAGQAALARGYVTATRTVRPGTILQDFHTFQSLPAAAGAVSTRAEALARRDRLVTSLTVREYRADVLFDAAVRAAPGARWPLTALEGALRRPRFALWLGRKSCPLAWPLDPRIVVADTAPDAFAGREVPAMSRRRPENVPVEIAVEERGDLGGSAAVARRVRRIDNPGDRIARAFYSRDEFVIALAGADG